MAESKEPRPCMEKTAAIMPPRQRVGANLRKSFRQLFKVMASKLLLGIDIPNSL